MQRSSTEAGRAAQSVAAASVAQQGRDDSGQHPAGLLALADYQSPGMPAEHVVRALWRRIRERFQSSKPGPVRAGSRLQTTTLKALDEVAGPPACGPLMDDFDAAVCDWLDGPGATFHCVVVLPPCDPADVIGSWAQSRGHAVLRAPARDHSHALTVIAAAKRRPGAADSQGRPEGQADAPLLVIPQLETWFLRRRNGLQAVRALLAELQQSERRCLIGCNSWAWAFLVRAAGAALVLPSPRTFVAFDAKRLQAWFAALGAAEGGAGRTAFRLASSGADVLATKEGGALASNYLEELAARSNGIPWVAWHLWRSALRTGIDALQARKKNGHPPATGALQQGAEGAPEAPVVAPESPNITNTPNTPETPGGQASERTFWITGVPDPDLPHHHDDNALLVLHALLMHGALDAAELLSVLPDATAAEVLPALLRNGFIEQRQGRLSVLPSAYPAARRALLADGFPVGEI